MQNLKKFSFLFLLLIIFGGFISKAEAATITADTTGDWSDTGTWVGDALPQEADDVVIADNVTVTLDQDATVNSILISNGDTATGITIEGTNSLIVNGNVTFEAPVDTATSTFAVGAGTVDIIGDLEIVSGAGATEIATVTISTGELNVDGSITFDGTAAAARLVSTGASTIRVGGDLESSGTFTRGSSEVIFNGSGAQNIGAHNYHDVSIDKSSGTATLLGETLILNELLVSAGTLDSSTHDLDITFLTEISSGATLIHGTGHKVQNGVLVIDEGGSWIETGAATVDFLGHVTNNGTFTANTGLHQFLNFTRDINGTFSIPNVSFIGDAVYTNNGTFTISTSLGGDGVLINGATGTLNIGDDEVDDADDGFTLYASTAGNTVNYNRDDAQVVEIPDSNAYDTLTLSGSGTKSIGSALTIAGDLEIDEDVKAGLTGSSTVDRLFLGEELQVPGVWGSTNSNADESSNSYFSGTGTVTVAIGATPRSTSSGSSRRSRAEIPKTPLVVDAPLSDCLPGYLFSPSTGESCGVVVPTAPTNSYAFGTALVRKGFTGEPCKAWQMFFNDKGNAGLVVDGMCGSKTIAFAKTWQASVGLTPDGMLGALSRVKAMMQ